MLASMSEIDPRAETPPMDWSDLGVTELLPTGTVTLLLADVEGSTRLWQTQPDEMTAAVARLDRVVAEAVANHCGVRPVEQGEGDSFVIGFARAGDAVACALDLQRAPLAPIRMRIGVHTGDIQLRDEGNYIGPTINRTARLRDLAHGGQTVLSGATAELVAEQLPTAAWLTDLGTHPLRDLPRPERVAQLCHPDLCSQFPPLRMPKALSVSNLPVQLTSFVGRGDEITDVRDVLAGDRLVTLTGAGGMGKTRLALEVAAQAAAEFAEGVCYVDLAPITDPGIVPSTVARALGLPDQPGRSTMETLTRFAANRQMLMVLDNCEHLLDASAEFVNAFLGACPHVKLLATSREPIGVPGEVTWRVPSLSLADDAIQLFADRAQLARPDVSINDHSVAAITEICRRLDGMPLAIELAAARVRALSLTEIADSLYDRFRLLTGGARTAVRRQQTLRASVDWSHELLTDTERILFRRLAAFAGGFDLDAAHAVAGGTEMERYHVLDQLSLLVDKSLVVAETTGGRTRYRLLETVRQYAQERLGESGEANDIRVRQRDYYTAMAAQLETHVRIGRDVLEQAETEMDNLRAAFAWSRENGDIPLALQLTSSLQPLWFGRGRLREGLAWFDSILEGSTVDRTAVSPGVRAGAIADKAMLDAWTATSAVGAGDSMQRAQQALVVAREIGDPALLVRALTACGCISGYSGETARPYLAEASGLARAVGDRWRLCQILDWQAVGAYFAGDPNTAHTAADEARDLADAIGDRFISRHCRLWLGWAQMMQGNLAVAIAHFRQVVSEAEAGGDVVPKTIGLSSQAWALADLGEPDASLDAARTCIQAATELGGIFEGANDAVVAYAALASGDVA